MKLTCKHTRNCLVCSCNCRHSRHYSPYTRRDLEIGKINLRISIKPSGHFRKLRLELFSPIFFICLLLRKGVMRNAKNDFFFSGLPFVNFIKNFFLTELKLNGITFAVRFLTSLLVSVVTDALVRSHHILTDAVGADAARTRTFVDIFAGATIGCQFVSWWTLTAETARSVDTFTTTAETRCTSALVDIFYSFSIQNSII